MTDTQKRAPANAPLPRWVNEKRSRAIPALRSWGLVAPNLGNQLLYVLLWCLFNKALYDSGLLHRSFFCFSLEDNVGVCVSSRGERGTSSLQLTDSDENSAMVVGVGGVGGVGVSTTTTAATTTTGSAASRKKRSESW